MNSERIHSTRKILQLRSSFAMESMLILVIGVVSMFVVWHGRSSPLLLSLYSLPIVIAGLQVGSYRSGALALLAVLFGGLSIFLSHGLLWRPMLVDVLVFLVWAATLGLTAVVTGMLRDACLLAVDQLEEHHESERTTDSLTGIMNRKGLEEQLAKRGEPAQQQNRSLTLILIDVDNFKQFNDRFGHEAGDVVLAGIANVMRESARSSDVVARLGGEEFVIVAADLSEEVANDLAERIRVNVQSARFGFQSLSLKVTASFGIAHQLPLEDTSRLMQRADSALYHSKASGRNCCHLHDGLTCTRVGGSNERLASSEPSVGADSTANSFLEDTTGLPTREVFTSELRRRILESYRYKYPFCIAVIGLDGYRDALRSNVRAAKDLVSTIARLTASVLRESDLVAVCSEDSLCILLPFASETECLIPLRRLCQTASELQDTRYPTMSARISVGIAQYQPQIDICQEQFLDRAIDAKTSANQLGGNRMFIHDGQQSISVLPIAPLEKQPDSPPDPWDAQQSLVEIAE